MSYIVLTRKARKPLLETNCLRTADTFARAGYSRYIFDSVTGQQCTQGGVTGETLAEFQKGLLSK